MTSDKTSFPFQNGLIGICSDLFDNKCCNTLLRDFNISNPICLALFATKLVGYSIVVGASLVKIPQVLKLFKSKSGAGITLYGVTLELLAITFNACYSFRNNFPFSAWGEALFLAVETALIAILILWYDGKKFQSIAYLSLYVAMIACFTNQQLLKQEYLWYMQSTVLPLSVSGKLMQAYKNFVAKHTGQLSALTAFCILTGSIVRVYTTIKETGDMLTAVTFVCSGSANFVIAMQVLYYWSSTHKFLEKSQIKKTK